MNTLPVPSQVQDISELRQRIALWDDRDLLLSDVPFIIGEITNPSDLLGVDEDPVLEFDTAAHGFWSVDTTNTTVPYQRAEDFSLGEMPSELARTALTQVVQLASTDARQFMGLTPDQTVDIEYTFKRGKYTTHPQAEDAHLDEVKSGVSYLCAIGPSTIFLPGDFTRDEFNDATTNSAHIPGIVFPSGTVLRSNALQLHRSPVLPEEQAAPRALAILEIKNR